VQYPPRFLNPAQRSNGSCGGHEFTHQLSTLNPPPSTSTKKNGHSFTGIVSSTNAPDEKLRSARASALASLRFLLFHYDWLLDHAVSQGSGHGNEYGPDPGHGLESGSGD
jgi:hypothetical protein